MSIASRITSMENNIRNAYHSLDSIGIDTSNTNKNIENISALLEDFYDSLPKVSGTGTNISLSPTKKGRIGSVLKGNTFQQTYTGKNLYKIDDVSSTTLNGITYSISNGVITLDGTASSGLNLIISSIYKINAGTYTFSTKVISGTRTGTVGKYVRSGTTNIIDAFGIETKVTKTLNDTYNDAYNMLFIGQGAVLTNYKVIIQMETGSTSSEIEPYVGGQSSPNPSYPQEIQSVTGLQNIKIEGKNLVNINDFTVQARTNYNQTIGEVYLEAGTTYYYSYTQENSLTSNTRNTPYFGFGGVNTYQSTSTNYNLTAGRKVWEYTPATTGIYNVGFWCHTPSNDVKFSDIMISKSSDTTYKPYQTPITKQLNLGNIKLNKISDNQDTITGTPNNWSIKRRIKNITLNGSETSWSRQNISSSLTGFRFRYTLGDCLVNTSVTNIVPLFCNRLVAVSPNDTYFATQGVSIDTNSNGYAHVYIDEVKDYTLEQFKTWLSTNNLEIDYILATETTESITNTELISQLNDLYYANSYNGTTNISVEGDLPMILDVSVLKEVE